VSIIIICYTSFAGHNHYNPNPPRRNNKMDEKLKIKRPRFTAERKREFILALTETGSLKAAASALGVSLGTIYNHLKSDEDFKYMVDCATKTKTALPSAEAE
jgi:AcrR family transcriptional regulator